jgi:hypothetical protein
MFESNKGAPRLLSLSLPKSPFVGKKKKQPLWEKAAGRGQKEKLLIGVEGQIPMVSAVASITTTTTTLLLLSCEVRADRQQSKR